MQDLGRLFSAVAKMLVHRMAKTEKEEMEC